MKNKNNTIVTRLSLTLLPFLINASLMALESKPSLPQGQPTLVIDKIYWDHKAGCLSQVQIPKDIPADALPMYFPTDSYCDELPNPKGNFEDVPVRRQIDDYLRIYQEILTQDPKNPWDVHSDSFLPKLQSAVYLVRDDLLQQRLISSEKNREQIDFKIKAIGTLYDAAVIMHNNKELTMFVFEYINIIAALIGTDVDYMYLHESSMLYAREFYYFWHGQGQTVGVKKTLAQGIEATIELIRARKGHDQLKAIYFPTAFIYSRKNIPIGYKTFTGALFNKAFPLNIANFFPHPPKKVSKDDPHWGRIRTLIGDINHDLAHRTEIFRSINALKTTFGVDLFEVFGSVDEMIDDKSIAENNRNIIIRGSFALVHELFFRLIAKNKMIDKRLMFTVISEAKKNNDIDQKTFDSLAKLISSLTVNNFGGWSDKTIFNKLNNPAEQEIADLISDNAYSILATLPPYYTMRYLAGKFIDIYLKDLKTRWSDDYKINRRDFERIYSGIIDENGRPLLPVITFGQKKKLCPVILDRMGVAALVVTVNYEKGLVDLGVGHQPVPFQMDKEGVITLPSEYTLMSNEKLNWQNSLYMPRQECVKKHLEIATMKFWRLFNEQMKSYFDAHKADDVHNQAAVENMLQPVHYDVRSTSFDNQDEKLLIKAARVGDYEAVKRLLTKKDLFSFLGKDDKGNNVLHLIAMNIDLWNQELLQLLGKRIVSLAGETNHEHETPLDIAHRMEWRGLEDYVQELNPAGRSPHAKPLKPGSFDLRSDRFGHDMYLSEIEALLGDDLYMAIMPDNKSEADKAPELAAFDVRSIGFKEKYLQKLDELLEALRVPDAQSALIPYSNSPSHAEELVQPPVEQYTPKIAKGFRGTWSPHRSAWSRGATWAQTQILGHSLLQNYSWQLPTPGLQTPYYGNASSQDDSFEALYSHLLASDKK